MPVSPDTDPDLEPDPDFDTDPDFDPDPAFDPGFSWFAGDPLTGPLVGGPLAGALALALPDVVASAGSRTGIGGFIDSFRG